jgi:hypothetical protein
LDVTFVELSDLLNRKTFQALQLLQFLLEILLGQSELSQSLELVVQNVSQVGLRVSCVASWKHDQTGLELGVSFDHLNVAWDSVGIVLVEDFSSVGDFDSTHYVSSFLVLESLS